MNIECGIKNVKLILNSEEFRMMTEECRYSMKNLECKMKKED